MTEGKQQSELLLESSNGSVRGPVFEAGPGWGGKLKKHFKKISAKPVMPLLAIAVLLTGIFLTLKPDKKPNTKNEIVQETITETVVRGDGYVLVARRVLANYLSLNTELKLTDGQKLFAEETLSKYVENQMLSVGAGIIFPIEAIKTTVTKALSLKPFTLQKWEELSKAVKQY